MAFILFTSLKKPSLATPLTNSLMHIAQCEFSNRFRVKRKYKWDKYGSLEHQINQDKPASLGARPDPEKLRSGALGYKIGMTSIFDKWGKMIPCTVVQLDR
jgi:hypothetical protein